ncbi:hypothetical protein ACFQ7B_34610 [Streptomyces erythrochromogenes]|uniref:COG1470 family protein n=1 Tax=Streptomyces erythrochromogenes TaxID=285574 RepID=UPI0036A1C6A2
MSVRAELTVPEETVIPGEALTAHLRVWNESRIVDSYQLKLVGPPADWPDTEGDLGHLPVYPGNNEKINIPISLPRDSALAPGTVTFAVRVASAGDPGTVAVPEAHIQVGEFEDTSIEPRRRRVGGALWSSNLIVVENTGNATATIRLRVAPESDDAPLRVTLRRSRVVLGPGGKARVSLMVRVVKPMFTGTAANWRVRVHVVGEQEHERFATMTHRQRPLVPKPALKALIALVTLLAALAALWFSPVAKKPNPKTTSAEGPSQLQAVQEAQQKEAAEQQKAEDEQKKDQEQKKKDQESAKALKKKPLRESLVSDTRINKPVDEYTVPKGYRLSVKTVQLSAAGPDTAVLFLKVRGLQELSTGVGNVKDYTPGSPLSLKEDETFALEVDCRPPPPGTPSPGDSTPPPPPPPAPCSATAVIIGELIPLKGPNAEDEKPPASPTGSPLPTQPSDPPRS